MKILLLNKDVKTGGGAGVSTYRLWKAYEELGHKVKVLVRSDKTIEPEWKDSVYHLKTHISERLAIELFESGWMDLFLPGLEDFHTHPLVEWADVIHLQNLHGNYFPYTEMVNLCREKPVVWTWRDFWPLTGGCPYPMAVDCSKYKSKEGCGDCPSLGCYPLSKVDTTDYQWKNKKKMFSSCMFSTVFPSGYAKRIAIESGFPFKRAPEIIPNGIELDKFRMLDKHLAKRLLNIEDRPTVIIQGSIYKNPMDAVAALNLLENLKPQVLVFGPHTDPKVFESYSGEVKYLNEIGHTELNVAFCAADLFIFPTYAETFGNVIVESMASGTACVGYNNSTLPEIMIPYEVSCQYGDVQSLSYIIQKYLESPIPPQDLRDLVETRFNLRKTILDYERLLLETIDEKRSTK